MEILDWKMMKNGAQSMIEKKYLLYGTGVSAYKVLRFMDALGLKDKVLAVCDSDEVKAGQEWNGLNVISPQSISSYIKDDIIVIIASVYISEICCSLEEMGYSLPVISGIAYWLSIHYDVMNTECKYLESSLVARYKEKYLLYSRINRTMNPNEQAASYYNLISLCKFEPCIFLHSIPKTGNKSLIKSLSGIYNVLSTNHGIYYGENAKWNFLDVMKIIDNKDIRIICGVREPLERVISHKWQWIARPYDYGEKCVPDLVDYSYYSFERNEIEWFNEEIKEPFGIDVFEYPFDTKNGYIIIKKNNISIFLYRLDFLNCLEKEIGEFCGVENFKLEKDNAGEDKYYAFAYKEYKRNIKVDKKLFDKLMLSKELTHFYTQEECEHYREKWKDKLC